MARAKLEHYVRHWCLAAIGDLPCLACGPASSEMRSPHLQHQNSMEGPGTSGALRRSWRKILPHCGEVWRRGAGAVRGRPVSIAITSQRGRGSQAVPGCPKLFRIHSNLCATPAPTPHEAADYTSVLGGVGRSHFSCLQASRTACQHRPTAPRTYQY